MIKVIGKEEMPKKEKIFVISPHPDDMAIAIGGAISILSKTNTVFCIVMCSGYRGVQGNISNEKKAKTREEECKKESKVVGAKPIFLNLGFYEKYNAILEEDIKKLETLFKKERPSVVFMPSEKDPHPAHKASVMLTKKVLEQYPAEVWQYETPWSMFAWDEFNAVVHFQKEIMDQKLKAIKCHSSQLERARYDIAANALAELRAVVVPEQRIAGYGEKPISLGKFLEAFRIIPPLRLSQKE